MFALTITSHKKYFINELQPRVYNWLGVLVIINGQKHKLVLVHFLHLVGAA